MDPTSGQITLRAEVPNPTGLLLPGMYVRVKLEQAETEAGIVVPQQAVTRGSTGDSVMVVTPDGKVTPRPVKIGNAVDGRWVVLDGLRTGEMVIHGGIDAGFDIGASRPAPGDRPTIDQAGRCRQAGLVSPSAQNDANSADPP